MLGCWLLAIASSSAVGREAALKPLLSAEPKRREVRSRLAEAAAPWDEMPSLCLEALDLH